VDAILFGGKIAVTLFCLAAAGEQRSIAWKLRVSDKGTSLKRC